mgnify:CR=1 FL=1
MDAISLVKSAVEAIMAAKKALEEAEENQVLAQKLIGSWRSAWSTGVICALQRCAGGQLVWRDFFPPLVVFWFFV